MPINAAGIGKTPSVQPVVFDSTGRFAFPVGLSALWVEWIDLHTGLQQLFNSRPLAGLDCKRNRTVRLHYFAELLPSQSRMFDLEVFDYFAKGVDYDNT